MTGLVVFDANAPVGEPPIVIESLVVAVTDAHFGRLVGAAMVYGGVPPETVITCEYAVPSIAGGRTAGLKVTGRRSVSTSVPVSAVLATEVAVTVTVCWLVIVVGAV